MYRMTFAPGKKQSHSMTGVAWERDLDIDLERIKKEYNAHALISLMRDNEYLYIFYFIINLLFLIMWRYATYEIEDIFEKSKAHDIIPIHYPIVDGGI